MRFCESSIQNSSSRLRISSRYKITQREMAETGIVGENCELEKIKMLMSQQDVEMELIFTFTEMRTKYTLLSKFLREYLETKYLQTLEKKSLKTLCQHTKFWMKINMLLTQSLS